MSEEDSGSRQLRFKQIQCFSVPNTCSTQCNAYLYGLTESGELWFKRDTDEIWQRESMACFDSTCEPGP